MVDLGSCSNIEPDLSVSMAEVGWVGRFGVPPGLRIQSYLPGGPGLPAELGLVSILVGAPPLE